MPRQAAVTREHLWHSVSLDGDTAYCENRGCAAIRRRAPEGNWFQYRLSITPQWGDVELPCRRTFHRADTYKHTEAR